MMADVRAAHAHLDELIADRKLGHALLRMPDGAEKLEFKTDITCTACRADCSGGRLSKPASQLAVYLTLSGGGRRIVRGIEFNAAYGAVRDDDDLMLSNSKNVDRPFAAFFPLLDAD